MNYNLSSEFEWDPHKSERCFNERGVDFAYATAVFRDLMPLVYLDERFVYGEQRYQIIGMIEHRVFVVAFTIRDNRIRIISARKANQREKKLYENHQIYH